MKSYEFDYLIVDPNGVSYATIEYHYFALREVLHHGKATGIYHVKLFDSSSLEAAVDKFKEILPGCEVIIVDETGILKLEYPICIIIKNQMVMENFNEIMSDLDDQLTGRDEQLTELGGYSDG